VSAVNQALWAAWGLAAAFAVPAAAAYLLWCVFGRRKARAQAQSWLVCARVEAKWGMVLALPPALLLVVIATSPGVPFLAAAALVLVVVGFYSIPVAIVLDGRIPRFARWVPTVVAIPTTLLILVGTIASAVSDGPWTLIVPVIVLDRGLASCLVAVRFARAVARRDAGNAPQREPASPSIGLPELAVRELPS
jgi:hypothetical protein